MTASPRLGAVRLDVAATVAIICLSAILSFISLAMALEWYPVPHEVRVKWDTATEANIWTWASVAVFLTGAFTHLGAGYFRWLGHRKGALLWVMTAAILAALSIDDLAALHETLFAVGERFGGGSGLTHFAWVIPGAFIAAAIVALFVVHIRSIAGRPGIFLIAGLLFFFAGALGVEMIGGAITEAEGYSDLYVVVYHIEEMLEAIGGALLLSAGLADLPANRDTLAGWLQREPSPAG